MRKVIIVLLLLMYSYAYAQESDSIRPPHCLREVEVLGLKQTPDALGAEAVTRISGAQARLYGVESSHNIGELAPNFYMPEYGSRMTSSIYVRGLGARIDQPVVGLTVDNVPLMNKDAYDFDIPNIESIEVLRGAQAILNGRNTMAGQINILTLSPLKAKGLRASISYGNGNTIKASSTYLHRLSEFLGMSFSAQFRHTDGFFRNAFTGRKLDHENSGSGRWKTVWRPSPALSLTNTASMSINRQGGYPYALLSSDQIAYNDTCSYHRTHIADGLTIAWAGKRVVVTSITSFQYLNDDMRLDQDFTTADYFTLQQKRKEWSVTEDLFTRGTRGRYTWLGGVFAFHKHTDMNAPVTFKDAGITNLIEYQRNKINPDYPITWDERRFTLGSNFTVNAGGIALYHQSTLRYGKWRIEAGVRLDYERTTLNYISHCNTSFTTNHIQPDGSIEVFSKTPVNINDGDGLNQDFLEFLPKLTIVWENEIFSPYLNIAKGYKAGGYNTQMFSDVLKQRIMGMMGIAAPYTLAQIVAYEPERSLNYEIGFHSLLSKFNVKLDGVLFLIDCRNQQLTTFPAGTVTGRIMTNAGRTRSFGAELTASWQASADINLRLSYGYTNATFRKYNNGIADYRGKHLPYAPTNTLFAEMHYRATPLSFCGITPDISLNVRGAGRIYWDEENSESQPFYANFGANIGFTSEIWSLRLWASNITNTRYNTFRFVSNNNSFVQRSLPRTFGATIQIRIL